MQSNSVLEEVSNDMAAIVEVAGRSVVQILGDGGGRGAGTVWHQDGLILTNAHVVREEKTRVLLEDGRIMDARVVAISKEVDLAALAVDAHDLPAVSIGDSKSVKPGAVVLAVGHPWGLVGAVTYGIAIGMELQGAEPGLQFVATTSAPPASMNPRPFA